MAGIESVARENGYNIMICDTQRNKDIEKETLSLLTNKVVDGAIIFQSLQSKSYMEKLAKSFPLVYCMESSKGTKISSVAMNNMKAAYDATEYLIKLGHKKISLISFSQNLSNAIEREEGFRKCLEDYKIKCNEDWIFRDVLEIRDAYDRVKALLKTKKSIPTAIFVLADGLTIGAIRAAYELNIKVPEDISIIGFGNFSLAPMIIPSITLTLTPKFCKKSPYHK